MISSRLFASLLAFLAVASMARADGVDDVVKAEMARTKTPGVIVGIAGADGKASTRTYGLADVELNVPVSDKTIFQSGSLGKQFTAVAVMLLVEEGKVKLKDPITKYFPGAPAWWKKITVRHLLTHTSGIPDYPPTFDVTRDYKEPELAAYAYKLKADFEPGARWNYSNVGYMLLGILIHTASDKFYGDLLKDRVFTPLGMKTARVISEADIVMNRSAGYRAAKNGELLNQEWVAPELNTTADGSLYLTVLDYVAWEKGLRAKAILKPESWAEIRTPVTLNSGKTYPYGFGWFLDEVNGEPVERHTGSWQGFRTAIARYVGRGLTVVVLANHASFDSGDVAARAAGKIDAKVAPPELKPISDTEPNVTARLKTLLADGARGKLSRRDLKHVPAAGLPADAFVDLLKPLGPVQRLDLLERRALGDDWVYKYDAVYARGTLRVEIGIAPDNGVSILRIRPNS